MLLNSPGPDPANNVFCQHEQEDYPAHPADVCLWSGEPLEAVLEGGEVHTVLLLSPFPGGGWSAGERVAVQATPLTPEGTLHVDLVPIGGQQALATAQDDPPAEVTYDVSEDFDGRFLGVRVHNKNENPVRYMLEAQ